MSVDQELWDKLAEMASPELRGLWQRVAAGIAWLTEHDPAGAFHFWFQGGLTPSSAMPRQNDEAIEAWRRYYRQRRIWEELWKQMERLERTELAALRRAAT